MRISIATAAVLGVLMFGCSSEEGPFRDARGGDGSVDDGSMTLPDGAIVPRDVASFDTPDPLLNPDSACATQMSGTQRLPMNLLIVLDRSGSMADGGPPSKWTSAVNGINRVIDALSDDTRVGLLLFPARSNPDVEASYRAAVVDVGPLSTTRTMIRSTLTGTSPAGGTPMACAMPGAVSYLAALAALEGSRNIVLITDGEPSFECSGLMCGLFDIMCLLSATQAAMTRIQVAVAGAARMSPPIRTFVIGTPEANASFLTNLAINGNTRRMPGCESGNTCHYSLGSASFERDLNAALDEIRGRAATCEFRIMIDLARVDANLVNVRFTPAGGTSRIIPRDTRHLDGWDYSADMRSVILYGPSCDQIRTDMANGQVQIIFGCPTVVPG